MKNGRSVIDGIKRIPTVFLWIAALLFASPALAADFRVAPVKLDFSRDAKSGVLVLENMADEKLKVQINAMLWNQDAEGKDVFENTQDVIFYPKIMEVEPKGKRNIRVGFNKGPAQSEKTYRIYIREIPTRGREGEGAVVMIAIRFGIPVFVKPLKEQPSGEISDAGVGKGALNVTVKNTGNVHFSISSIKAVAKNAKGEEVFIKELTGWYLLSGISRRHTVDIPKEACPSITTVELEVKTDAVNIKNKTINVKENMCSQ